MKIFLLLVSCSFTFQVFTQPNIDSAKWEKGGLVSITLAQGGTRNWSPGGDRFSLALNGFARLHANKNQGRKHWDNLLDANFGLVNTRVAGVIKNDDKFDFNSRWSYELGKAANKKFRTGFHINFRSQFADGYDYDGPQRKRISAFFAPATLILSPGLQYYSRNNTFNVHFSPVSLRWVIVANRPYELSRSYSVEPNEKVKIEAGSFASVNFKKEIINNINYTSRLDLFSDFVGSKPQNIDVFWTNMFYMKINKRVAAVYNFDLQYDDDTRIFGYSKKKAGTQLKSIFGVGLSFNF